MRKVIVSALWLAATLIVAAGGLPPVAAQKKKKDAPAPKAGNVATAEEVAKHLSLAEPTNGSITRIRGVEWFVNVTPPNAEVKAEVARKLIVYAEDNDSTVRGTACEALRTWATAEQAPKLMVLLTAGRPAQQKGSIVALGHIQHEKAIPALVRMVEAGEHRDLPVKALVAMGPKAEKPVAELLAKKGVGTNPQREACGILLQIGTDDSVPALKEAAKHKDKGLANAAQSAIEAIEERARNKK